MASKKKTAAALLSRNKPVQPVGNQVAYILRKDPNTYYPLLRGALPQTVWDNGARHLVGTNEGRAWRHMFDKPVLTKTTILAMQKRGWHIQEVTIGSALWNTCELVVQRWRSTGVSLNDKGLCFTLTEISGQDNSTLPPVKRVMLVPPGTPSEILARFVNDQPGICVGCGRMPSNPIAYITHKRCVVCSDTCDEAFQRALSISGSSPTQPVVGHTPGESAYAARARSAYKFTPAGLRSRMVTPEAFVQLANEYEARLAEMQVTIDGLRESLRFAQQEHAAALLKVSQVAQERDEARAQLPAPAHTLASITWTGVSSWPAVFQFIFASGTDLVAYSVGLDGKTLEIKTQRRLIQLSPGDIIERTLDGHLRKRAGRATPWGG